MRNSLLIGSDVENSPDRLEFYDTPNHGSWVNTAETAINVMKNQCLKPCMDSVALMAVELANWEARRNALLANVHWTFTLAAAGIKLKQCYPSDEGRRDTGR